MKRFRIYLTMYHTKTPDTNGWYWVRFEDADVLCYWNPEDPSPQRLMRAEFMPNNKPVFEQERIQNALAWIGPLESPFGEFGSSCAYFDEDQYVSAIELGEALVMTLVDGIGSDRNFGTVASHYQMPLDEALEKTGGMMRTIDRNNT